MKNTLANQWETYDKIFHALDLKVRDVAEAMIQLQSGDDELAATSIYN
ncbi:hypothetical protein ACUL41_14785 [Virgibacillus natechei]